MFNVTICPSFPGHVLLLRHKIYIWVDLLQRKHSVFVHQSCHIGKKKITEIYYNHSSPQVSCKQRKWFKFTRKIQSKVQVCKCSPIIFLQLLIIFEKSFRHLNSDITVKSSEQWEVLWLRIGTELLAVGEGINSLGSKKNFTWQFNKY